MHCFVYKSQDCGISEVIDSNLFLYFCGHICGHVLCATLPAHTAVTLWLQYGHLCCMHGCTNDLRQSPGSPARLIKTCLQGLTLLAGNLHVSWYGSTCWHFSWKFHVVPGDLLSRTLVCECLVAFQLNVYVVPGDLLARTIAWTYLFACQLEVPPVPGDILVRQLVRECLLVCQLTVPVVLCDRQLI